MEGHENMKHEEDFIFGRNMSLLSSPCGARVAEMAVIANSHRKRST